MENSLARAVRAIYQRRPYPDPARTRRKITWQLPPPEWIQAIADVAAPPRILVAGCGTGNEAFALRRRFPEAEIVALDFSTRALALARTLERSLLRRARPIAFQQADLSEPGWTRPWRETFDFISAHGVFSYIPAPARALRHLAACLTSEGAVYLGVNGAPHYSTRWRPALRALGFDPARFPDNARALRGVLGLCDALAGHAPDEIAGKPADYLAGDLFGPLITTQSLDEWSALAAGAGLEFHGSYPAHRKLRRAFADRRYRLLFPRGRAEAQRLAEQLAPSSFHQLLFRRTPPPVVPWKNRARLLRWRPERTGLYRLVRPKAAAAGADRERLVFESEGSNTRVELQAARWVRRLLRAADGTKSLASCLADERPRPSAAEIAEELYPLELLAVLNFRPPLP